MKKIFVYIFFLIGSFLSLNAQNYSFNGYISGLYSPILSFSNNKVNHYGLLHNRLNFKYTYKNNWNFVAEVRNRLMFGNYSNYSSSNFNYLTKDDGLINLSWNITNGKYYLLNSSLERLYVSYEKDKIGIIIGRQRINWSQTLVFNPNDIFNSYSFFDFDYPERKGSDAIRLSYYPNETSVIEIAAKININNKLTIAGFSRFNAKGWDFQALTGIVNNEDFLFGGGFSGELKGINLRGEFSYYIPYSNKVLIKSNTLISSFGLDYFFSNSISLSGEVLYNQNASTNSNSFFLLLNSPTSSKYLSISNWTAVSQISYPFTPIFTGSLAAISFINIPALYFGPSIECSISDDLSLSTMIQTFISGENKSNNLIFGYLRLKYYF